MAQTVPTIRDQENSTVAAVQHFRRMRGGAQAHLVKCSDENYYVVKFQNNPQHVRVLANELFATRLARYIGLPVPETKLVEVGQEFILDSPALTIELRSGTVPCQPGLHFGSQYLINVFEGRVFDFLPLDALSFVRNQETFAGVLALDKWTGNADGRQAAFWRKNRERRCFVSFIDQGHCFNAGQWDFPDHPLRGVYCRNEVYQGVRGWDSFEPWLSRIEEIEEDAVWRIAGEIPPEWFGGEWRELENLIRALLARRGVVRSLIDAFRLSGRCPFPNWTREVVTCNYLHSESGVNSLCR